MTNESYYRTYFTSFSILLLKEKKTENCSVLKIYLRFNSNLNFESWLCLLPYEKEGGQKYAGDIVGNGTLLDQDLFFLQRHQMLVHHEKELDHLKRMMERKEEELIKNQVRKIEMRNSWKSLPVLQSRKYFFRRKSELLLRFRRQLLH